MTLELKVLYIWGNRQKDKWFHFTHVQAHSPNSGGGLSQILDFVVPHFVVPHPSPNLCGPHLPRGTVFVPFRVFCVLSLRAALPLYKSIPQA